MAGVPTKTICRCDPVIPGSSAQTCLQICRHPRPVSRKFPVDWFPFKQTPPFWVPSFEWALLGSDENLLKIGRGP